MTCKSAEVHPAAAASLFIFRLGVVILVPFEQLQDLPELFINVPLCFLPFFVEILLPFLEIVNTLENIWQRRR